MKNSRICKKVMFFCSAVIFIANFANGYNVNHRYNNEGTSYALATVYFKQKPYIFERQIDSTGFWRAGLRGENIECFRFDIDNTNGELRNPTSMRNITYSENSGTTLCACCYRNKIYVFYDNIGPYPYTQRFIDYKCSSDPALSWDKEEYIGKVLRNQYYDTGFGSNGNPITKITASVLNDKIYVFYTLVSGGWPGYELRENIICWVYDGKTWTRGVSHNKQGDHYRYITSQTIKTNENQELIALPRITMVDRDSELNTMFFDGNNYVTAVKSIYVNNGDAGDLYALYGGLGACNDNSLLVIMAYQQNGWPSPGYYSHCYWCSPRGSWGCGGSAFKIVQDYDVKQMSVPILSYTIDSQGNLQQYVTALAQDGSATTYASDYFQFNESKTKHIDARACSVTIGGIPQNLTESQKESIISMCSIIGVIEGVPPFPSGVHSNVDIGKNTGTQCENSTTYSSSIMSSIGIGIPKLNIGVGMGFVEGFRNIHNWDNAISKNINYSFKNEGINNDGRDGFLILQVPKLTINNYEHMASDRTTKLEDLYIINVKDYDLTYIDYNLEDPSQSSKLNLNGMARRWKSSDYLSWRKRVIPHIYNNSNLFNTLTVSTSGGCEINLTASSRSTIVQTTSSCFTVDSGLVLAGRGSEKGTELTAQNTTTLTNTIKVSLSTIPYQAGMEKDGSNMVEHLEIQPYLLSSDPNNVNKADWIPSAYSGSSPWCLTWKVVSAMNRSGAQLSKSANFAMQEELAAALQAVKDAATYCAEKVIYGCKVVTFQN